MVLFKWNLIGFIAKYNTEMSLNYVKEYDDVENIANMFLTNYFMGINSFDYLNQIGMVDVEYLTQVLNDVFKEEKMVISIVKN